MTPWARLALAMLVVAASCNHDAEDRAQRAKAWSEEVALAKAEQAVLVHPGDQPRRLLVTPLLMGDTLDADVEVRSTIRLWSDYAPEMTRTTTLTGRLRLVAGAPKPDDAVPIALQITDLAGDLRDLAALPKTGTIELGAFGEPWVIVLDHPTGGEAELAWTHDVKGWARRVLVPLPGEPVGSQAAWRTSWDDWLGLEQVVEHQQYALTSITDTAAQLTARATTSSSAGDGEATATIEIPLGHRGVPRSEWHDHGTGRIVDHGKVTNMEATSTTTIRPHVDPSPPRGG